MNHKDYSNRQQKRSTLTPPTVNRLWAAHSGRSPVRSRSTRHDSRLLHRRTVIPTVSLQWCRCASVH